MSVSCCQEVKVLVEIQLPKIHKSVNLRSHICWQQVTNLGRKYEVVFKKAKLSWPHTSSTFRFSFFVVLACPGRFSGVNQRLGVG